MDRSTMFRFVKYMLSFHVSYVFCFDFREMKEGSPSEREDEGGGGLFTNPDLALQVCKEDYRNNMYKIITM